MLFGSKFYALLFVILEMQNFVDFSHSVTQLLGLSEIGCGPMLNQLLCNI